MWEEYYFKAWKLKMFFCRAWREKLWQPNHGGDTPSCQAHRSLLCLGWRCHHRRLPPLPPASWRIFIDVSFSFQLSTACRRLSSLSCRVSRPAAPTISSKITAAILHSINCNKWLRRSARSISMLVPPGWRADVVASTRSTAPRRECHAAFHFLLLVAVNRWYLQHSHRPIHTHLRGWNEYL